MDEAVDGGVLAGGLQVLADGDEVDAGERMSSITCMTSSLLSPGRP
jgi:hypothetical protein